MNKQETPEEAVARLKATQQTEEEQRKAEFAKLQDQVAAKRAADDQAAAEAAQAREAERAAAAEAEFNRRFKTPALDAWVALGGSVADFEKHWREEAPKRRMAEAQREADAARESMRHSFYREF